MVAHQFPLSMDFQGKNTGVGCNFLFEGIFLTQGSNPSVLHWQADSLTTEPPGKQTSHYLVNARVWETEKQALAWRSSQPGWEDLHSYNRSLCVTYVFLFCIMEASEIHRRQKNQDIISQHGEIAGTCWWLEQKLWTGNRKLHEDL